MAGGVQGLAVTQGRGGKEEETSCRIVQRAGWEGVRWVRAKGIEGQEKLRQGEGRGEVIRCMLRKHVTVHKSVAC